ncbi:hypothetical protein BDV25DRAFT_149268 [Aspergillus avenaceus]|uniref:Arrestin-like N-terminal domain-containing protein n=1 Tax=Aspergillus avenaceus TaxID=36643 RepID=A0A5N6U4K7_ASPAV|nr:hypothetical protein BDV25DRAFT_149268 [Aspergillus avenaceus]
MPIDLHLENQVATYSGQEVLRGSVVFHNPHPIEFQDIRVTFRGRAKAKVQKKKGPAAIAATYRSKCVLFEQERILMDSDGAGTLPRDTYTWPFEFTFPSLVQSHARWPEKHPFRSDEHHPLPPSFAVEVADEVRKLDCLVEYRIEAQVFKPQKSFLGKKTPLLEEVVRLNFLPPAAQLARVEDLGTLFKHQREEMFTVRSLLLLPENRGRSLGFGEKVQSWLSPKQLPRFDFRVSFVYSTRVVQSSPIQCVFDIVPFLEQSSVTNHPDIVLQAVSMAVYSRTAARASPSLMGAIAGDVDERIEILSKTSLGMPVRGQLDFNQVFGPMMFKHSDVSFATFNMARTYRLSVSATFECAGKTMEFNATDLGLEIVSSISPPVKENTTGTSDVSELADTSASSTAGREKDPPPSYSPGPSSPRAYEKGGH